MKYLSEEPFFKQLVRKTAGSLDMWPDEIIKDYFMIMALKAIVEQDPNLVMKGGTSLSKAYGIINRFSEDIDIAVTLKEKYSLSKSKINRDKYHSVSKGLSATGLDFEAADQKFGISERRNMNVIALRLPIKLTQLSLLDYVKIEEETFSPAFPIEKTIADNYLKERLYPTDKKSPARSRDFYDIVKINEYLNENNYDWSKFPKLFTAVRKERYLGDQKTAFSSNPKYNIGNLIELALQNKKTEYAEDFARNTVGLMGKSESLLSFDSLLNQLSFIIRQPSWQILWQTTQQIPHQQRKPRER